MRPIISGLIASFTLLAACHSAEPHEMTQTQTPSPSLMTWADLLARERPEASHTIKYGSGESDVVDVWLPEGAGPHPVVIMVHGGCWQKAIADRTLMNYAAEDLRQAGLAVWNIEYRGVDEAGGGYPGTFLDVANAIDQVREVAETYNLDLSRIVGFGHSAGGHLVTWAAARENLPDESALKMDTPVKLSAVVNSGGLADLEASAPVTQPECLANVMDALTGQASQERPNVLTDTSPAELLPFAANVISVNGDADRIAPATLGEQFTQKIKTAGGAANFVLVDESGHVELIAPGTAAFETQKEILIRTLK